MLKIFYDLTDDYLTYGQKCVNGIVKIIRQIDTVKVSNLLDKETSQDEATIPEALQHSLDTSQGWQTPDYSAGEISRRRSQPN